jgi:hypothetical protein
LAKLPRSPSVGVRWRTAQNKPSDRLGLAFYIDLHPSLDMTALHPAPSRLCCRLGQPQPFGPCSWLHLLDESCQPRAMVITRGSSRLPSCDPSTEIPAGCWMKPYAVTCWWRTASRRGCEHEVLTRGQSDGYCQPPGHDGLYLIVLFLALERQREGRSTSVAASHFFAPPCVDKRAAGTEVELQSLFPPQSEDHGAVAHSHGA